MFRLLSLLVFFLLLGCGEPVTKDTTARILLLGDSMFAANAIGEHTVANGLMLLKNSPPQKLPRKLGKPFSSSAKLQTLFAEGRRRRKIFCQSGPFARSCEFFNSIGWKRRWVRR